MVRADLCPPASHDSCAAPRCTRATLCAVRWPRACGCARRRRTGRGHRTAAGPCDSGAARTRGRAANSSWSTPRRVVPASAIVAERTRPQAPRSRSLRRCSPRSACKLQRVEGRIYSIVPQAAATAAAAPAPATAAAAHRATKTIADDRRHGQPLLRWQPTCPEVHAFLSQQEVEALPRLAEDALKAVHRLPGAASNGLAGLAHMRGGDTNETLVHARRPAAVRAVPPAAAAESRPACSTSASSTGSTCTRAASPPSTAIA